LLLSLRNNFSGVIPAQEGDSGRSRTQDTGTAAIPGAGKMKKNRNEDGCAIRLTTQEGAFLARPAETEGEVPATKQHR
jgi:hypothetical protein